MESPARSKRALGFALAATVCLLIAGFCFARPKPLPVSGIQLDARAAAAAHRFVGAVPAQFADALGSLQSAAKVADTLTSVAGQDTVSAARVWSPSGVLLASSQQNDVTVAVPEDRAAIAAASGIGAHATSLSDPPGTQRTFSPVGPTRANAVVLEVDQVITPPGFPWGAAGFGFAVLAIACLGIALLSFRSGGDAAGSEGKPSPPIGGEAPPEADSGVERELERALARIRKVEASRAAMEIQLEQLRNQAKAGATGSDQAIGSLQDSLSSAQLRAHKAGEELKEAEHRAAEAEARAAQAEQDLAQAAPATGDTLADLQARLATATATIGDLSGKVAEHEARTRDAEAQASEAAKTAAELNGAWADLEARLHAAESRVEAAEAQASEVKPAAVGGRSRSTRRVTRAVAVAGGAAAHEDAAAAGGPTQEDVEVESVSAAAGAAEEMSAGRVQDDPGDPQSRRPRWLRGLDGKVADAESSPRTGPAKKDRASKGGSRPTVGISLAEAQGTIEPVALPELQVPATEPASAPASETVKAPKDDEPTAAESEVPEAPEASATDPEAWNALAKTLRRNALGEDTASQPDVPERGDSPAEAVSDQDSADLRARLARASAKKRRSVDGTPERG